MRLSIDFSPFELVQTLNALPTKKAEPAPTIPVQVQLPPPALHVVAFELCSGRLKRNMIDMIKRHRELTGNGLKESKDAIQAAFGREEWIVKGVVP